MSDLQQLAAQQTAVGMGGLAGLANAMNLGARAYKEFQVGDTILFRYRGDAYKEGLILKKAGEMYRVKFSGWFFQKAEWIEWYSIKGVLES